MVIVDTSIWMDHLFTGIKHLKKLLLDAEVMCHEFVIGELACVNLKNATKFLFYYSLYPPPLWLITRSFSIS